MKNKYCFDPTDGTRGTVTSDPLFDEKGQQTLCNVVWEMGQHSTEKIENISLSNETNHNPPKW